MNFPTFLQPNRLVVALVLIVAAGVARADECQRMKLKAVGKVELRRLVCHARFAMSGDASRLATCESDATATFWDGFAKAGSCAGDQTRCADVADGCVEIVTALLNEPLPSACEAAKRKAAGRLAKKTLDCWAKAARTGASVDSTCIGHAQERFASALTRAGTCPDGGSPQSEVEAHCVLPVVGSDQMIDVCPPSTSTSTTSTTTTSTLPDSPCSNPGEACGSCGTGVCMISCEDPQAGTCVASIPTEVCLTDEHCAALPGTRCVGRPFCGSFGCGCQGWCVTPCP